MGAKSYFISDLHLGAPYISDPRAHEARIVSWLEAIAPDAARLYMLGDVMDYWYEYRTVAPRGHVRFLGALARLADSGCEIVWLKGNHDIWIFDYLPREIGLRVVDGTFTCELDGKRFLLEHGDGVGEIDRGYALMRRVFRNRFCQLLYGAIHPRWTIAFAHGWSGKSRKSAPVATPALIERDTARLRSFAENTNASEPGRPFDYFVFGHLHLPSLTEIAAGGAKMVVLGDAYRSFSYGEWDGTTFRLKKF